MAARKSMMERCVSRIFKSKKKFLLMHLFDRKLREKWKSYLWQSGAATLAIFLILLIFTELTNVVIVAAVGATTFTVFAIPKHYTARARNVIGGHIFGTGMGLLFFNIHSLLVGGSLAVGATMLLMVITNTEHPPAAGTALGLIVSPSLGGVGFILGSAFGLSLIKRAMDPWMEDLAG
ncbi:MAG: HPP family protein [Thermodesulfobacteriota bacterium]